jgi:hypothetical protein
MTHAEAYTFTTCYRTPRWLAYIAKAALLFIIALPAHSSPENHYMIDDDNLSESYWAKILPDPVTRFYETTLPNFFGAAEEDGPSITFSIQQMSEDNPALSDDEKKETIELFKDDPLHRKALVIEVPIN